MGVKGLQGEEIPEELEAVFSGQGFGMKLHPIDGFFPVAQAHDFTLGGFRGDLESPGKGVLLDEKGVIACGLEGRGQIFEKVGSVMAHGGGFSVHQAAGADNPAAKVLPDALVAEADSE